MPTLYTALQTYPLRDSMDLYWDKIMLPQIHRYDKTAVFSDLTDQIDDWEWTWSKDHACHCRSRGGSKTFDFVNYVIYRVIRTKERWGWLASKGGQLSQSMIYFQQNPCFSKLVVITVGNSRKHFIELRTGDRILIGIVSTSNLGLRLDGIVIDEEEDMESKQSESIYPQMEGMMTTSATGQFLHLGTLWIGTRFNENTELYPSRIRPWDQIRWLTNSPKMQAIMNNKNIAEWEKDLLYRCIPTTPNGVVFPNLVKVSKEEILKHRAVKRGFDFGGTDTCVGIDHNPGTREIWCVSEQLFDIERFPNSLDSVRGAITECESGGYNENDRYGNKCAVVCSRLGASGIPVTNQWKADRQKLARECTIYICPELTPLLYKDLHNALFGPDGLYLKNNTDHQCHFLDAFLHSIGSGFKVYNTKEKAFTSVFS